MTESKLIPRRYRHYVSTWYAERPWDMHAPGRWRLAAPRFEWHSNLLGAMANHYAAKLVKLRAGSYRIHRENVVEWGDAYDVASAIVVAREERTQGYVHHATRNAVLRHGRPDSLPEMVYAHGILVVRKKDMRKNADWRRWQAVLQLAHRLLDEYYDAMRRGDNQ